jgi:WD40 repeat protein
VTPTGTEPPAVPDFNLKLPFLLTMNAGEQKLLRVDVERLRGNQAISVTLSGLPTGVFAQPATIDPEKSFVDVLLMAAPNSTIKDTEVEVVANNGKNKVVQKFQLALKPASGTPTPPIVVSKSEQEIRQFPWASPALLNNVAYGLDDSHFFTASFDNQLRRWHLQTGFENKFLRGPEASGRGLALTADRLKAFAGYSDGSARLWDLVTGKLLQTVQGPAGLEAVAVSPDGRYGLTGGGRGMTENGQTTYSDCLAIAWDLATGKELARYTAHQNPVRNVAISPDGKFALSHAVGGTAALWELTTGKFIRNNTRIGAGTSRMVYAPDGKHFFTTHGDRNARMWNAETLELVREFRGHEAGLLALAVSPDGKRILTGGGSTRLQDGQHVPVDCALRLWDVESGREIQQFPGHAKPVVSVAFAPDSKTALSSAHDQTIRLWDLSKAVAPPESVAGAEVRSISCAFVPTNLFYLPASKHVLTANSDSRLRTWEIETSKELHVLAVGWAFAHPRFRRMAAALSRFSATAMRSCGTPTRVRK